MYSIGSERTNSDASDIKSKSGAEQMGESSQASWTRMDGRHAGSVRAMTLPNPKKKRPLETASHVGATVVLPQSQSSVLTQHISVLSQPSPMTSSMLGVLPLSSQPLSSSPFMTSSI